jgi:hypothetical protein
LFRRLIAFDGNNSLKRLAKSGRSTADTREFTESDYYLANDYVDRFKNEVPARAAAARATAATMVSPPDIDDLHAPSGERVEHESSGPCADKWKATKENKSWAVFDENGIFGSACRHGFILWVADMVQTGEQ